jgi:hypothetical protein
MTDAAWLAWCAGLFDGEGSIGIYRVHERLRVSLRLAMTDEATVRHFRRVIGFGTVRRYERPAPRQPAWYWFSGRRCDVLSVLGRLRPFLITKASQADMALRFLRDPGLTRHDEATLAGLVATAKKPPAKSADAVINRTTVPVRQLALPGAPGDPARQRVGDGPRFDQGKSAPMGQ